MYPQQYPLPVTSMGEYIFEARHAMVLWVRLSVCPSKKLGSDFKYRPNVQILGAGMPAFPHIADVFVSVFDETKPLRHM